MNNGMVATLTYELEPKDNLLPPDFALIGNLNSEPRSLDKVLRGLDADEWKKALDYEISQLEKFGTWVVEDLQGVATISINESWALPCRTLCIIPRRSKMGYHSAFWAGIDMTMR